VPKVMGKHRRQERLRRLAGVPRPSECSIVLFRLLRHERPTDVIGNVARGLEGGSLDCLFLHTGLSRHARESQSQGL
jgi:hypothetical protein